MTLRRACLIAVVACASAHASASDWTADPAASRIVVHAFRSGLLGALGHDHHLVPRRSIPVDVAPHEGGGLVIRGRAAFQRSEFGVRTPAALLGAVSVKDRIEVEFELVLSPSTSSQPRPGQKAAGNRPRDDRRAFADESGW